MTKTFQNDQIKGTGIKYLKIVIQREIDSNYVRVKTIEMSITLKNKSGEVYRMSMIPY